MLNLLCVLFGVCNKILTFDSNPILNIIHSQMKIAKFSSNQIGIWFLAIFVMVSCDISDEMMFESEQSIDVPSMVMLSDGHLNSMANFRTSICGEVVTNRFLAGQHIEVGSVNISNDNTNLYVEFTTTGDWYMTETHLLVGSVSGIKNPAPGKFPYKANHDPAVQSYTYVIALNGLSESFSVAAHAAVVKVDSEGNVLQGETAWGEGPRFTPRGNWAMYMSYTVQECDDNDDPEPCVPEEGTAWSDGERYTEQGNWATYTVYNDGYGGEEKIVNLITGADNQVIGTVHFSSPDFNPVTSIAEVTITINMTTDCWSFRDEAENVKIEGYWTNPSGNPQVGLFSFKGNASGDSFSIKVPEYNIYGVHVDVLNSCCPDGDDNGGDDDEPGF